MGYIDDPSLLQTIIDTLNIKQLPGEVQLPYPLPVFPGVSQVINLNDFLKTRVKVLTKTKTMTGTVAAGATEGFSFSDIFPDDIAKNNIYKLNNMGISVPAPAVTAPTTGSHEVAVYYPSPVMDVGIFNASAAYNVALVLYGNTGGATLTPNAFLGDILRPPVFSIDSPFSVQYRNNTDADQAADRQYSMVFTEEVVKGL